MYFLIVVSLVMAVLSLELATDGPPPDPVLSLAGAGAAVGIVLLAGLAISGYILWRRGDLATAEQRFLRRVGIMGRAYRLFVVAVFAAVLFPMGWACRAWAWAGIVGWTAPALAVALAPLVAMLLAAWVALYWADRRLRAMVLERAGALFASRPWSLPRYLEFMLRQHLLVILVPMLVLVTAADAVHLLLGPAHPAAAMGAVLGLVLTAVLVAGPWVRVCWRTARLPDGDLRSRLEALARRAGVGVAEILVWRTHHSIANGCMIGVVGPLRYIMITDALLESLSAEEVEAVFAHEIAHVKYHHVPMYVVLAMVGITVAAAVGELTLLLSPAGWAGDAVTLALLVGFWVFAFGYVSRRCELECDLYAARATSCPAACSPPDMGKRMMTADAPPDAVPAALAGAGSLCEHRVMTFVSALRRLARLNGSAERARGWRHFSIARRCEFLMDALARPDEARRFERGLARLKAAVFLATLAMALVAGVLWGVATMQEESGPTYWHEPIDEGEESPAESPPPDDRHDPFRRDEFWPDPGPLRQVV